jgi:hypothetical protein
MALSSISKKIRTRQQLGDSLLPYLTAHGQHVGSIELSCDWNSITLHHLPPMDQLTSLQFECFKLQLQAGNGFQGVLGSAGLLLKRLRLESCNLLDGQRGLAISLTRLLGMEHLSMQCINTNEYYFIFSTAVLRRLQQLTHLELNSIGLQYNHRRKEDPLQPLLALTRLSSLHLAPISSPDLPCSATGAVLSQLCHLRP